jgi:hypothetical protein
MGGKGLFDSDTVKQYEDWAKLQGVTKIRALCKRFTSKII